MLPTPILVVTGPPASGKSFIAGELSRRLALPLIAKDGIKEVLYDSLGVGDRAWSRRLGGATYALMLDMLGRQLEVGRPCVVEGTFATDIANVRFAELGQRWPFVALQIFCLAPHAVLVARYAQRAPARHPGHVDAAIVDGLADQLGSGVWEPLELPGRLMKLDTRDFEALDMDALESEASVHVTRPSEPVEA
jgi:predicted kinase